MQIRVRPRLNPTSERHLRTARQTDTGPMPDGAPVTDVDVNLMSDYSPRIFTNADRPTAPSV